VNTQGVAGEGRCGFEGMVVVGRRERMSHKYIPL
jgi:hypothetical protein